MHIPDTLIIVGRPYKITQVQTIVEYVEDSDSCEQEWLEGYVDPYTAEIRLATHGRDSTRILQTLLHEVMHAVSYELQLAMNDADAEVHADIDRLAVALAAVLVTNGLVG